MRIFRRLGGERRGTMAYAEAGIGGRGKSGEGVVLEGKAQSEQGRGDLAGERGREESEAAAFADLGKAVGEHLRAARLGGVGGYEASSSLRAALTEMAAGWPREGVAARVLSPAAVLLENLLAAWPAELSPEEGVRLLSRDIEESLRPFIVRDKADFVEVILADRGDVFDEGGAVLVYDLALGEKRPVWAVGQAPELALWVGITPVERADFDAEEAKREPEKILEALQNWQRDFARMMAMAQADAALSMEAQTAILGLVRQGRALQGALALARQTSVQKSAGHRDGAALALPKVDRQVAALRASLARESVRGDLPPVLRAVLRRSLGTLVKAQGRGVLPARAVGARAGVVRAGVVGAGVVRAGMARTAVVRAGVRVPLRRVVTAAQSVRMRAATVLRRAMAAVVGRGGGATGMLGAVRQMPVRTGTQAVVRKDVQGKSSLGRRSVSLAPSGERSGAIARALGRSLGEGHRQDVGAVGVKTAFRGAAAVIAVGTDGGRLAAISPGVVKQEVGGTQPVSGSGTGAEKGLRRTEALNAMGNAGAVLSGMDLRGAKETLPQKTGVGREGSHVVVMSDVARRGAVGRDAALGKAVPATSAQGVKVAGEKRNEGEAGSRQEKAEIKATVAKGREEEGAREGRGAEAVAVMAVAAEEGREKGAEGATAVEGRAEVSEGVKALYDGIAEEKSERPLPPCSCKDCTGGSSGSGGGGPPPSGVGQVVGAQVSTGGTVRNRVRAVRRPPSPK